MSPEHLGPATLAITQAVTSFQFFLPRLEEVRKADVLTHPDMAGDVRLGEVAASTLTLGVGMMISSLSGSPYPAMVSVLMMFILVCVYETALRTDHALNPPITRAVVVDA